MIILHISLSKSSMSHCQVTPGKDGAPPIATAHSISVATLDSSWASRIPNRPKDSTAKGGLPLVFFGAYLWTSCAGDLLPVEGGNQARLCDNSGNKSLRFSRKCTTVTVTTGAKNIANHVFHNLTLFWGRCLLNCLKLY